MRSALKVIFLFLLVGIGAAAGGGYEYLQLEKTRESLQAEIHELEERSTLLKKKYAEQKALVGQFMRAKARLEGRQRTLQKELEEIRAEKQSAQGTSSALRAEIQKKERTIASLNQTITEIEQDLEKAQKKREQLVRTHQDALKEKELAISELKRKNGELEADIERSRRANARCRDRNARLCVIANELVEKYKNKGVGDALAQKEPFTQVKKVELEKLIQEYQDRIEKEKLNTN
jgi:chromosome segregation ATPase